MEPPSVSPRITSSIGRGASVGRYVVLSTLGAGAMGVVFAAYDPELDRKVALKLLKTPEGGQTSARVRLQREAQALAKLDHRNVVAVYDVGVHDGELFVSMEFVAGQTLREWIRERAEPRPWSEITRVFMAAGRGLAAAHEVGLIHRDFKPDNVMVGDDGRVRVMDFGLARAGAHDGETVNDASLDELIASATSSGTRSQLTQTGAVMGTPAYMSPEQFEGRTVDARSDQFGFCVALYEALYGERPFGGQTLQALLGDIQNGRVREPPPDSTVPGWLRRVVLRGLAADPEARWETVQALLDALSDDPSVRRRRWAAAVAAIVTLGLGAWGLVGAAQTDGLACVGLDAKLEGSWDRERRAEVQAALEATGLAYASGTWSRIEPKLDDYAEAWVEARVATCEASQRGEQSDNLLDLRMACLDARLLYLRETVDLLSRADATVVEEAVGAVFALPGLERCADADALLAEIAPPEDPRAAARARDLSNVLVAARAQHRAGKFDAALARVEGVLAEAEELDHEPSMARVWLLQGELQAELAQYEDATTTLKQALDAAIAQEMSTEAASAANELIFVEGYRLSRHEQGWRWAELAGSLVRASDADEAAAERLDRMGLIAQSEGKYAEARTYHERALAMQEARLGPEHLDISVTLNHLGVAADYQGKYAEARAYYERSLQIKERALGPRHIRVAAAVNNVGVIADLTGDLQGARTHYERALKIKEDALGPDHPQVASSLSNLGVLAQNEGEVERALHYHERALKIFERSLGPEHPTVALVLSNIGSTYMALGRYPEARTREERALAIREQALGAEHPKTGISLLKLGNLDTLTGDADGARELYSRALEIFEAALGPDHSQTAQAAHGLGQALLLLDRPAEAIPLLERALVDHRTDAQGLTMTRFVLAQALWEAPRGRGRDRDRAIELAEFARATAAEGGPESAKLLADVERWLTELRAGLDEP